MPEREIQFNEEKAKKIAVGATVAGVILILFLVIVLIIQFVQIGVARAKEKELSDLLEEYNRKIEEEEADLESYTVGKGLYYLALQNGYKSAN